MEHEQYEIYRRILKAFAPKPVTMRTLDIGGDKPLSYFPTTEENPFLGWRGHRPRRVRLRGAPRGSGGLPPQERPADDLVAAVRIVAAGDALLAPTVTRRVIEAFWPAPSAGRD